ncbi:MAG: hypothetical protein LBS34_03455 [Rickettsiales bacterium]|jgi:glutamine synthetase|nr:hypothetical protein [Rickettsiales bacterium]
MVRIKALGKMIIRLQKYLWSLFGNRRVSEEKKSITPEGVCNVNNNQVECGDTHYCVDDCQKINKKIAYSVTPQIFYITKNISSLLRDLFSKFTKLNYTIKIGLEIEFYSLAKIDNLELFYGDILDFLSVNGIDTFALERERGDGQFEIQFRPYMDLYKLIDDYNKLKIFLLSSKYKITFGAMPFYYDVGSALQVNITLNRGNENLFSRRVVEEGRYESELLKNCIAGLLYKTNTFLPLYIKSNNCLLRYDKDFCKIFYKQGKIPGPTHNSWGVNNRTCSIRIPTPKNFSDIKHYHREDNLNRRIEFRVPSSDSDIRLVIYGVLNSMLYGIENNLQPMEGTINNVFDDNENYEMIELAF